MGRFRCLLILSGLLALTLPVSAQESTANTHAPQMRVPQPTQDFHIDDSQLRVPPPSEDASYTELDQQGDKLRAKKEFLDAIDYYRVAMKKSDTAVLHNKIGMCYLQLRRDSEAKKEFVHSIKENKNYSEAYNNLGALYYNTRRYGSAVKEYKKALKLNAENASFHSNLGGAYFSLKDFDKAAKEYQRAVDLDPDIFLRQSSASAISIRLIGSNDLGHFHYVMAQMYGQHGDEEHCRYYLSKANEEGYPTRDAMRASEFAILRKDPNFVLFLRSLKPPPPSDSN